MLEDYLDICITEINAGRDGSRKFDGGDRGIHSKYIKVTYKNKKTFNSILAKR
jgi:hypothetical protein